jgi:glutamyl-tRNA reductase
MTLLALGLNHQTAPVALRERVAFAREAVAGALAALRREPGVIEAALVSTCNRSEIYCTVSPDARLRAREFLARAHGVDPVQLDEFLYCHEDEAAVRHLYRVACGLDSMVLGEPQILGQVKDAYQIARGAGSLGPALERLFQSSFAVAKRVRTDTQIGASPVSVAYAAVRLAARVFGDFSQVSALLIGAGDTIELAARHLSDSGIGRLLVANRTYANAEALAANFGAQPLRLADLSKHLAEVDLVISSTASRAPIISRAAVATALEQRRRRPMLLIDLAVPRDIEAEVATLRDVFLYGIDDLANVIADNLRSRQEAAREAELIVELQVEHYLNWWRAYDHHGALRALRDGAERERDQVLERARAELAHGRSPDEVLQRLAHALTNKLLHAPSVNLRAAALRGDADLLRAAERLFGDAAARDE